MSGLSEGSLIANRYKIVRELGEGNFGKTYMAKDLHKPNHPLCVVKQFKPLQSEHGTFRTALRLFNQEAAILQQLGSHPDIPNLDAFFEENNNLYLVQEYIDGNVLSEEIIIGQPWQEEEIIKLLKQILIPLKYVHEKNIVHRDLKPDNLMRRAENGHIVLIDFGAVKQISQEIKKQGTVIGTIGYMPPEQYEGTTAKSCDVYALGVIVIEALTGKKIKEFTGPIQALDSVHHISDGLKNIILKMTRRNDQERYGDEIQKKANYGKQKEPDYTEFKKIVQRVEEILVCTDFNKNPVTLACNGNWKTIEGTINGVSLQDNNLLVKLSANSQIYNISVSLDITQEIFGSNKLTEIQGKSVVVKTNQMSRDNKITVEQPAQLKILNDK
ncbi:serine/threonine protein kinase (plasmid) [Gloeothece citriformis PCC 7424]|uniref:non-specific serine/threonine protein kinase n=1 Tax=Gloeothece citriformis (strain PCC 7424) TaxID=65393 RepID=B7KM54_GLOC7|nr:serine/threonine-protein kinase [Gloeothece citriformis]ACK73876.1 serine/threonine protein kinase [Gloeothece citriformis PCC 7424]